MGIVFRIRLFQIRTNRVQIGDSLSRSDARLQTSHYRTDPTVSAITQAAPALHLFLVNDRHKEIRRENQNTTAEPGRRHADDRKRMLVELDRAAHHVAVILKMAMPVGVGEHDIRSAVRSVLIGGVDDAPEVRLNF